MLADPQQSNLHSATFRKILQLLEGLQKSKSGSAVYAHIGQMLESQETAQLRTEQTLCTVLRQLLDTYSMHLPRESTLYTQIKLLQLRLSPPLAAAEVSALRQYLRTDSPLGKQAKCDLNFEQVDEALRPLLDAFAVGGHERRDRVAEPSNVRQVANGRPIADVYHSTAAEAHTTSIQRPSSTVASNHVASSLRDIGTGHGHFRDPDQNAAVNPVAFERRRGLNELDKRNSEPSDDEFSRQAIHQSLAQTEEIGSILETGLRNLRHASDEQSFENRKQEVLSELEKLLSTHRHLTGHFDKMATYLASIQTDSERLNEELSRVTMLSLTDDLTGLPNRRAFIQRLQDEVARVQRYGHTLSLAIMDLDGFKPINDTYGHPAGDAVLNIYAKSVLATFRRHDLVARYGGEEFAVIFPYTEVQGALQALKKIQQIALETVCRIDRATIPLPTFSAGLAVYQRGESVDALIKRADRALYLAKERGRNRIESV